MKKTIFTKSIYIFLSLMLALGAFAAFPGGVVNAATITVCAGGGCDYTTIQAAIDAAADGDVVEVHDGTYNEYLRIDKPLTLSGESKTGVIIDPDGAGGYGIYATSDDLVFENFTLRNAETYGLKISGSTNVDIHDVIVQASGNTNVDLNGVNNAALDRIEAYNSTGGNGFSITDSNDITVSNSISEGNRFTTFSAGVMVAAHGVYHPGGSDNIVFSNNDFREPTPIYTQQTAPYVITNLDPGNYDFVLKTVGVPSEAYFASFDDAKTAAELAVASNPSLINMDFFAIKSVSLSTFYVDPDLKIQTAVNAAEAGDTVYIWEGTYEVPQLVITTDLTMVGESQAGTIITPLNNTGSSGDSRGWFVVNTDVEFNLNNVTLDGSGKNIYQSIRSRGTGTIDSCTFKSIVYPPYSGTAIVNMGGNMTISNNDFTNIGRIGIYVHGTSVTDTKVLNNTYTGKGEGDWLDYAIEVEAGAVAVIEGNTITGNVGVASTDGSSSAGILATTYFGSGTTATILNNQITDCTAAIAVGYNNTDTSVVIANYNQIVGNEYGVISTAPLVDAQFNWWGDESGPSGIGVGSGDSVGEDVDYSPWLGFVPGTSPMTFHTNDSVQDAIDEAVSGDTVMVKDGTYIENLIIDKDLTVMGESLDTIVQAPENFSKCFTTSYDAYPVVCVQDAEVSIDSLTVDGAGHGNSNYKFMGIAYRNAGGVVQNAQIIGIENTPFSGAQHGVAMYVLNDDTIERTFTIDNVLITDFQKNAMALNASADTPLTVYVLNNEIVGHGATTVTAQNGIQVYGDLITGTIENNDISGIAYDNTDAATKWVASSILNFYADVDVIGNTITEAQTAVYNIDGGGRFANNEIEVNKVGVSGYGMILTDPPAAVPSPFVEATSLVLNQTKSTAKSETENVVVLENNAVIFVGADNADTIGIEADAGYDVKDMDLTLNQNTVMGFDYGIVLLQYVAEDASDAVFTNLVVNFNRIVDNTVGLYSDVAYMSVNAENNWWGCNEGPGASDCDPTAGTGAVDADPWIVLSLTADPEELEPGMSSNMEANLVMNSAGVSTAADGYIPQGLLVTFTAPDGGTLDPASGLTVDSAVATVFTPPEVHGDYDVCAAVDNELLCLVETVVGPGAVDDAYTTEEDKTLEIAAPGVLANDTGIETIPHVVALLVEPLHGQVTLNADGSFTYVPNPGFVGDDTFAYQVVTHPNDFKTGWTDEAVVTITVTPGIPVTGDTFIYLPFIVR